MSDCIITPYSLNRKGGYGKFTLEGKQVNHSRAVYVQNKGLTLAAIQGKVVRHTCHNPACINPDHLVLGTWQDNMDDKMRAGKWRGGQPKKLTPEQVEAIRSSPVKDTTVLAVKFGVSRGTIQNVLLGKSCYPLPSTKLGVTP
jgi:hypothetical protein